VCVFSVFLKETVSACLRLVSLVQSSCRFCTILGICVSEQINDVNVDDDDEDDQISVNLNSKAATAAKSLYHKILITMHTAQLFQSILSNHNHVLAPLFPDKTTQHYHLIPYTSRQAAH